MDKNTRIPNKPLPTPSKRLSSTSYGEYKQGELLDNSTYALVSPRIAPSKSLPPKPIAKSNNDNNGDLRHTQTKLPLPSKQVSSDVDALAVSPRVDEISQSKQFSRPSVDLGKYNSRHRASVGSRTAVKPDLSVFEEEKKHEQSPSPNFFKRTNTIPSARRIEPTTFDINTREVEATSNPTQPVLKDSSPTIYMLGDDLTDEEVDKKSSTPKMKGLSLKRKLEKTSEDLKQQKKENVAEDLLLQPVKPEVILPTNFLKKYMNYFTHEDQESKIRFIPKNLKGEIIMGDELMMHTAELVFTEFMFCVKLQIFQEIEKVIRSEISLLGHQDFLLFEPLDDLVQEVSQLCLELEPIYYNLLNNHTDKKSELNNVFLIVAIYNSYILDKPFKQKFKEFVAHYTALGNEINIFVKEHKQLNKVIQDQLENCIDQNIKEITDFFFSATQRICRYELLFGSVLKEMTVDGKEKDILKSTMELFKIMNTMINKFIFQNKIYYLKKYEYLDIGYKSNIPIQMVNTIKSSFTCSDHFIDIFYGIKNTGIKLKKTELILFYEGILKRYVEEEFYEFYPINTLEVKKEKESKKEFLPTDVYFFDIKKNKIQIISLGSEEEKVLFNSKVKQMFELFKKSLSKHK